MELSSAIWLEEDHFDEVLQGRDVLTAILVQTWNMSQIAALSTIGNQLSMIRWEQVGYTTTQS